MVDIIVSILTSLGYNKYIYYILRKVKPVAHSMHLIISLLIDYIRQTSKGSGKKNIPPTYYKVQTQSFLSDFSLVGYINFYLVKSLTYLKNDETILEIGCGVGGITLHLAEYLSKEGLYYGIDVNSRYINWCKKNIGRKHPNFHFQKIDVYNSMYNPLINKKITNVNFPYKNNTFDLVFANGVFIHIQPQVVEHYIREIFRTLKKGGRLFLDMALFNNFAELQNYRKKYPRLKYCNFNYYQTHATINKNKPDTLVLYKKDYIISVFKKTGFTMEPRIIPKGTITLKIKYGNKKKVVKKYLDIIICYK